MSVALLIALLLGTMSGSDVRPGSGDALKKGVISNYAAIAGAAYGDALRGVRDLDEAIHLMLERPNNQTFLQAKAAWEQARVPYLQTEGYRFTEGPIETVEGRINSWPIDENYIDYVEGDADAGVINNAREFPTITEDLLVSLNEKEGEKNISVGFHAIEFLLWGQDFYTNGPGRRPVDDFVIGSGRTNVERRREYLRLLPKILIGDLQQVCAEWDLARGESYVRRFLNLPLDEALAIALRGIGSLSGGELLGERLTVPYETKEQEDEHSCFSDTTLTDFANDLLGIQNLYLGHYRKTDGKEIAGAGFHDLLQQVDPSLAGRLKESIEATIAAARAIPGPFDQAIPGRDDSAGRRAIKKAIQALTLQTELLSQAGKSLSLKLNL